VTAQGPARKDEGQATFHSRRRHAIRAAQVRERSTEIRNPDGSVVFRMDGVRVPEGWSQVAVDVLVQKYFRKAGVQLVDEQGSPELDTNREPVTGSERDARQVFDRLAECWTHWGRSYGYFDTEEDAVAFRDELAFMLAAQVAAPNSPQWFNTGLHWAYGITGPAQGTGTRPRSRNHSQKTPTSTRSPTPASSSPSPTTWSTKAASWTCGPARRGCSSTGPAPAPTSPACAARASRCRAAASPPD
jgi:hypothetical protein